MMAGFHILFGFDDKEIVRTIVNTVKKQKYDVEFSTATTKDEIRDYLYRNKSVTTLVLREVMGAESFSAEELAQLNDTNNYNIIVVVDASHKGQPFMQILYAAGITSAILLGEKSGASPATIADLVLNQRSRKKSRDYYGMTNTNVKIDILTSDIFIKKYAILTNEEIGFNIIDRYVQVVRQLTVKQAVEFTGKLPPNIIRELMQYEEYYKVLSYFRRNGYKVNTGKRPKNLKKGLPDEVFLGALSSKKKIAVKKVVSAPRMNEQPKMRRQPNIQRVQSQTVRRVPVENPVQSKINTEIQPEQDQQKLIPEDLSMGDLLGVDQDVIAPEISQNQDRVSDKLPETGFGQPEAEISANVSVEVDNKVQTVVKQSSPRRSKGQVRVVSTSSAFNKGKKTVSKSRGKKYINWRLILIIFGFGILCLILWYFSLSLMKIM